MFSGCLGDVWGWIWNDLGMALGCFGDVGDDFGILYVMIAECFGMFLGWFWDDVGTIWECLGMSLG